MAGTYAPAVPQQYFDNSGNPLSSGTIETFIAGTSTHATTYSDVNLATPNANPMTLDAGGRPPAGAIFLNPGLSYKFLVKDSIGSTMATPDNISAIPSSSATTDDTGVAGETLLIGQVAYLSDGSGGKTAGLWYKGDSANAYSSILNKIALVTSTIASGSSGTLRVAGLVTNLSSLTVGAVYYIGTAGAITTTAPTSNIRVVGQAETTTSLLVGDISVASIINNGLCDFRLTLTTVTPVTVADVTAATTIFCTPYLGNRIALFNSSGVSSLFVSSEISIAVPATTSQMYDVFCFNNAGVPALELLAWTNDTTRATNVGLAGVGVYVKFGDFTRRYLGSFRTTTVSGQTEDSVAKRYVWNYYNRIPRQLQRLETTASWPYNTATIRQANGSTANQVEVVIGIQESAASLTIRALVSNNGGGAVYATVGIGLDSTTTILAPSLTAMDLGATFRYPLTGTITTIPPIGRHFYSWNEYSVNSGVTTWYGIDPVFGGSYYGLTGWVEG